MKNIILISLFAITLQGCSFFKWINDKSYEWGKSMPVKDGYERCEGNNFC